MAQAICIITASGLKCSASRIKQHLPAGHTCKVTSTPSHATLVSRIDRMSVAAKNRTPDVFTRVIELMIAAGVTDTMPFTIVKGKRGR
jgi:hypothetical protein